tara:strand:- start:7051 stop:7980 length:930 start_codon:yes stop_codon:yes gene_type:complete
MKINKPKFWDKSYLDLYGLILLPISYVYRLIFKIKSHLGNKKKFSVPIICVGNIYVGGTGKTPLAIKLCELMKTFAKPVILKKNYKDQNDEQELIKKYTKIVTCNNRETGIVKAIEKKFDLIILDDGFQDSTIEKDLNIVCFNLNQKIGNGQVIPSGPLRSGLSYLKNCNIVMVNGKKDSQFEERLKKYNRNIKFFYFNYILKNFDDFKNKKLISFAGIGNPSNFFDILKMNRLNVIKEIEFPDHYNYSEQDLDKLIELEKKYNAKLITTEKDYLRIKLKHRRRFGFVPIKVNVDKQDELVKIMKKILK